MKIVVTGALGHIGSRVIREIPLVFPDAEIIMVDNLLTQRYCSLFNLPVKGRYRFIEADLLDMDLRQVVEGADVVLHLAAITNAEASVKNRELVEHVNYNATVKVAKTCCDLQSPMIHLSSTSVYGTQKDLVDEESSREELKPQSPYAETKLKEEDFLRGLGSTQKFNFVICRFGTICGISPGMRFHTAVNKFVWQACMGQPITVWKTAMNQKRPYLNLDDAVRALFLIITQRLFDRRIYNVLTTNATVGEIIAVIQKFVPDLRVQLVDSPIMNQLSYEVSDRRFRSMGFDSDRSLEKPIKESIELLKNIKR
jgi:nucleoside-diphosphate-sugar epimerase